MREAKMKDVIDDADRAELEALKVNNLEKPLAPSDDDKDAPIPDHWTPAHVCRRLIDAFDILNRYVGRCGPKDPGNSFGMAVNALLVDMREGGEFTAAELQAVADDSLDAWRPPVTKEQIKQMERAFEWIRWLRQEVDPALANVFGRWANARARKISLTKLANARGWSRLTVYRKKDKAAELVAAHLVAIGDKVF
jgi:hypothetical protein